VAGARPGREEREGKKREGRKKGKRKKERRKRKKEGKEKKGKEGKGKKNREKKGKEIGKRFRKIRKMVRKLGGRDFAGFYDFRASA
jgi:hypothetical protein